MKSIVALHGFLGSSQFWSSTSALLKATPLRTTFYAPDLYHDPEFVDPSWAHWPSQFSSWLSRHSIENPFVLLGYSMGGRLALNFALQHPQKISHLILISTRAKSSQAEELEKRKIWESRWAERFLNEPVKDWFEAWNQQDVFGGDTATIERPQQTPQQILSSFKGWSLSSQPHGLRELEELRVPQLWLIGENDKKYLNHRSEIEGLSSNPEIGLIKAAGHRIPLEQPQALVEHIVEFIQRK